MATDIKKYENDDCRETVLLPLVDIYENGTEYSMKFEVPGVARDNLNITLEGRELEIRGNVPENSAEGKTLTYSEYTPYNFYRRFKVDEDVDGNKIDAKLDNGILTLVLHKREEAKPKKIEIH